MIDTDYHSSWGYPRASIWSGMNMFMINPNLAVVNEAQVHLIKLLEKKGVDSIPLPLRNCRTLSDRFHCVSLEMRRKGSLKDYS